MSTKNARTRIAHLLSSSAMPSSLSRNSNYPYPDIPLISTSLLSLSLPPAPLYPSTISRDPHTRLLRREVHRHGMRKNRSA